MINTEEYNSALEIVKQYERELNRKFIKDKTCICCKINIIKPVDGMSLDYGSVEPLKQEIGPWEGGDVCRIDLGYGSRFDMSSYYIGLCDDCIEKLENEGLIEDVDVLKIKIKEYNKNNGN